MPYTNDKITANYRVQFPHMDADTYFDRYKLSVNDRLSYWSARAEEFIDWQTMFKQVEVLDDNQAHWFVGGELNVASNCLDRHLETKGDDIAIIWCAEEEGVDRKISYKQLHSEVCSLSNALAAQGLQQGDVVCMYSTMLPEIVVSMLACARLGLVYEFVDLEESLDLIAEQIASAQPKLIITQDTGVRSGKKYPLYERSSQLADQHACIDRVMVVRSQGGEVSFNQERDVWYHQVLSDDNPVVEPAKVDATAPLFMSYLHDRKCHLGYINAGYLLYCAITQRRIFDYQDGDIFWVATNFNVVTGHALAIWGSLINGATTVLYDGNAHQLDSTRFWQIVSDYEVNLLYVREDGLENMVAYDVAAVERQSWQSLRVVGLAFSENNQDIIAKCQELSFDHCQIITTTNLLNTGQILFAHKASQQGDGGIGDPFFGIVPVLVNEAGEVLSESQAQGDLKLLYSWPSQNRILFAEHAEQTPGEERPIVGQWQQNQSFIHTGLSVERNQNGNYFLTKK